MSPKIYYCVRGAAVYSSWKKPASAIRMRTILAFSASTPEKEATTSSTLLFATVMSRSRLKNRLSFPDSACEMYSVGISVCQTACGCRAAAVYVADQQLFKGYFSLERDDDVYGFIVEKLFPGFVKLRPAGDYDRIRRNLFKRCRYLRPRFVIGRVTRKPGDERLFFGYPSGDIFRSRSYFEVLYRYIVVLVYFRICETICPD